MGEYKVNTQLRLDERIYSKIKVISVKELRSMNAQIEYFILRGIEAYEKENGIVSVWGDGCLDPNE